MVDGHRADLPRRPADREGGARRDRRRPRISAAPRCTRACPASATTSTARSARRTRKLREICQTTNQRRDDRAARLGSTGQSPSHRCTRRMTCTASSAPTTGSRSTPSRSSPASSTARSSRAFKPDWGSSIVTGFARIWGHLVGIIANDGIIFSESALKATHFIELCEQRRIPLVFLQNTSGYMVGARRRGRRHRQERRQDGGCGRQRHGAQVHGAHRWCVRRRQLRHVRARLPAAVPVRVAELADRHDVGRHRRDGARRHPTGGMKAADTSDERRRRAARRGPATSTRSRAIPYYATSRLWDDGLIDPAHTRDALGLCLALAARQDEPAARARTRVPDVTRCVS